MSRIHHMKILSVWVYWLVGLGQGWINHCPATKKFLPGHFQVQFELFWKLHSKNSIETLQQLIEKYTITLAGIAFEMVRSSIVHKVMFQVKQALLRVFMRSNFAYQAFLDTYLCPPNFWG